MLLMPKMCDKWLLQLRFLKTLLYNTIFHQMHNLPRPFKTACEDKHLAGFKKYTKSACLLKCRADYVINMCKCRSYDLEGMCDEIH